MSRSLLLLLIDFAILFLGLIILSIKQYDNWDWTPYIWGGIAMIAAFATQMVLLKGKHCRDEWLFPIVMFFSNIGIIMLGRLKPVLCIPQIRWLLIGMAVMLIVLYLEKYFDELLHYQYILGTVTLLVLCLSLLFGTEIGGSKNWLVLGPIQVQPSEFGKILLVLFLASYLSDHRQMMEDAKKKFLFLSLPPLRFIAPLLCIWGIAILMFVIQRDLGSALLFFCMAVGMTYMATGSKSYVFIAVLFFGLGAALSYALFSHVQLRFNIWIDPWADPNGQAYQVVQSLFAFGTGGILGTGFAHGQPFLIPEAHTDFIFAAIGEELGFLGCGAIMLAYILFFYRSLKIALNCSSDLYMLVAAGFAVAFFMQAFIIIAGVTKFLPLTGITLPFISYGGSSMLSSFIMLGLLLALSNRGRMSA